MLMNIKKNPLCIFWPLSLAAGILFFLSWPPYGFTPLIFIAFVPILFIDEASLNKKNSLLSFFLYIFTTFLTWNILSTYWIALSSVWGFVTAVILNSLFMSIPIVLMQYTRRTVSGNTGPLLLVFLWLSFEFLHLNWELSWPWLHLGNVFAANPSWVQWYEYTGVLGGSAWVIIINILLFELIKIFTSKAVILSKTIVLFMLIAAFVIIPLYISQNIFKNYKEVENPVEVVVVQPGFDPYDYPATLQEVIKRYDITKNLAETAISPNTDFILSPEASTYTEIQIGEEKNNPVVALMQLFSKRHNNVAWVAGSFVKEYNLKDDSIKQVYNSAVIVKGSDTLKYYHKNKLVPGIERLPYYNFTRFASGLVEKLGGTKKGFSRKTSEDIFVDKKGTTVSTVICYESVFGEYTARQIKGSRGELLFIITNDGWWRKTAGYQQHFHYARLRAIENRRSIARAASTGVSGFIGQRGNVIKKLEWAETGAISCKINANDKTTFYAYHGDYLGRLSVFMSLLIILYLVSQRIINRGKQLQKKA